MNSRLSRKESQIMGLFKKRDIKKFEPNVEIKDLIIALKDKEDWKDDEWKALEAFKKIGTEGATEVLIQALEDIDNTFRESAAEALGKIRSAKAVNPLIQALKDIDWDVREKAAAALGKIGDIRAVEPLAKALKDENKNVRESAAKAIKKMKDTSATEMLTANLGGLKMSKSNKEKNKAKKEAKLSKEGQEAAEGIKAVEELIEIYPSLFGGEDEPYFDRAIEKLCSAGTEGSNALAQLILELLACRSKAILIALHVANYVERSEELVNAVKTALTEARDNLIVPPPLVQKFLSDLAGPSGIALEDRIASLIKERSEEILQKFGETG